MYVTGAGFGDGLSLFVHVIRNGNISGFGLSVRVKISTHGASFTIVFSVEYVYQ